MLNLSHINNDWTLFLDRDGVINEEKYMDYIYHYGEFKFLPGVLEALNILADVFPLIIVATNQRGVGKGLMTEASLIDLQTQMVRDIKAAHGRIDAYYYCTSVEDTHPNRKPNPGMALQAQLDFPDIEFSKSIMVGNTISDMNFGRNAGMYTVHVRTTHPEIPSPHSLIDLSCENLLDFAKQCLAAREQSSFQRR